MFSQWWTISKPEKEVSDRACHCVHWIQVWRAFEGKFEAGRRSVRCVRAWNVCACWSAFWHTQSESKSVFTDGFRSHGKSSSVTLKVTKTKCYDGDLNSQHPCLHHHISIHTINSWATQAYKYYGFIKIWYMGKAWRTKKENVWCVGWGT